MNRRILVVLDSTGRQMTARELSDRLDVAPRRVIGRLQSLRKEGAVAYWRNGAAPSAPGRWTITDSGLNRMEE